MLNYLRKLLGPAKESIDDLTVVTSHSQKAFDLETNRFLFAAKDFGIIPPFVLQDYLNLYLTNFLAKAVVDAEVNLMVSDLEVDAEDDDLIDKVTDFNKRIDLASTVYRAAQDCAIFGFFAGEIVGNGSTLLDSTEVLGIKRLDPRFMFIVKDKFGRLTFFRQRPGRGTGAAFLPSVDIKIPSEQIVYIPSISPFTSYGHSTLQSAKIQYTRLETVLDATVKAADNHASPVNHLHYQSDPERAEAKEEIAAQVSQLKKEIEKIDKDKAKWILSGGRGVYQSSIIGADGVPDLTKLISFLVKSIIISSGLSPAAIGMTDNSTKESFENSARQQVNNIVTKQRNLMQQLNIKLYSILPFIEQDMPTGDFEVRMKPPTTEQQKESNEALAISINNVERLWKNGALSESQGARMLGLRSIHDTDRWEDWIEEGEMQEPNPNDPNAMNNAAAQRTLNAGKMPSANPSGGNGRL